MRDVVEGFVDVDDVGGNGVGIEVDGQRGKRGFRQPSCVPRMIWAALRWHAKVGKIIENSKLDKECFDKSWQIFLKFNYIKIQAYNQFLIVFQPPKSLIQMQLM